MCNLTSYCVHSVRVQISDGQALRPGICACACSVQAQLDFLVKYFVPSEVPAQSAELIDGSRRTYTEITGLPQLWATGFPQLWATGFPEVWAIGFLQLWATGFPQLRATGFPQLWASCLCPRAKYSASSLLQIRRTATMLLLSHSVSVAVRKKMCE